MPSLTISYDESGNLVVTFPAAISGSGIRTGAQAGQEQGNTYLFAPVGIVDAGEAGIACNTCIIGAKQVANVSNIDIGKGGGVGVPVASTGSLAAGLTGAGNLTAGVSQMASNSVDGNVGKDANSLAKGMLGMLSVDVIGFGD